MKLQFIKLSTLGLLLFSCQQENNETDAFGTFEAIETIISAETNGKILEFNLREGEEVAAGKPVGCIDSTQLHLNKLQLLQNQKAILSNRPDIKLQIEALERELDNAISDRDRIQNLVKGEVASQKQLDDANTRIIVLKSRLEAQKSMLNTSTSALNEQARTVSIQLAQVEDQLKKCKIINPINGTVLTTYANPYEMVAIGKPLYKVADLSTVILRAYATRDQFSKVKVGQAVTVVVDGESESKTYPGSIAWINNKAEFTPKTIQTKDERANLVYAIKVNVKNDGLLKIGMYGEVKFN